MNTGRGFDELLTVYQRISLTCDDAIIATLNKVGFYLSINGTRATA